MKMVLSVYSLYLGVAVSLFSISANAENLHCDQYGSESAKNDLVLTALRSPASQLAKAGYQLPESVRSIPFGQGSALDRLSTAEASVKTLGAQDAGVWAFLMDIFGPSSTTGSFSIPVVKNGKGYTAKCLAHIYSPDDAHSNNAIQNQGLVAGSCAIYDSAANNATPMVAYLEAFKSVYTRDSQNRACIEEQVARNTAAVQAPKMTEEHANSTRVNATISGAMSGK